MTEEQKAELEALAIAKSDADEQLRGFGYTNIAGRSTDELRQIAKIGARLEAEARAAGARLKALQDRLAHQAMVDAMAQNEAKYGHIYSYPGDAGQTLT